MVVRVTFYQSLEGLTLGYPLMQGCRHRRMVGLVAMRAGGDAETRWVVLNLAKYLGERSCLLG